MNNRFFTKTFTKFFFGFILIIGGAFGVLIVASSVMPSRDGGIDNVATPK